MNCHNGKNTKRNGITSCQSFHLEAWKLSEFTERKCFRWEISLKGNQGERYNHLLSKQIKWVMRLFWYSAVVTTLSSTIECRSSDPVVLPWEHWSHIGKTISTLSIDSDKWILKPGHNTSAVTNVIQTIHWYPHAHTYMLSWYTRHIWQLDSYLKFSDRVCVA